MIRARFPRTFKNTRISIPVNTKTQRLIALGHQAHHDGLFERCADPAPLPGKPTPMAAK